MAILKKKDNTEWDEGVEKWEPLGTAGGNENMVQPFGFHSESKALIYLFMYLPGKAIFLKITQMFFW